MITNCGKHREASAHALHRFLWQRDGYTAKQKTHDPLTFVIEQIRAVMIFGKLPDWAGWGFILSLVW